MPSLYETNGHRKYLTAEERERFLKAAERFPREVRTFCGTLAYTGCRISKALALTMDRVDLAGGALVFESLKKRKSGVYRAVPVPPALLDAIDLVPGIREAQENKGGKKGDGKGEHLWTWSRATASRRVHEVMQAAGVTDPANASPKGLRHAFGVAAVGKGIPLNLVQRWLGHAQVTTTAIYADAIGEEERSIASRMW